MKIERLKVNGMECPMGYSLPFISISWNVTGAKGKAAKESVVTLARDENFTDIVTLEKSSDAACKEISVDLQLCPRSIYYVKVHVTDDTGDSACAITRFETGKCSESWDAKWIGTDEALTFNPVFEKNFVSSKKRKKARLYICGLGLYEAYINGFKVGDEFLTPNLNNYDNGYQVQTYDVTEMITNDNTLSVRLGNGWYKGVYGEADADKAWGDKFALIAELVIDYYDGSAEKIVTDESFTYHRDIIENDGIYSGETINADCDYDTRKDSFSACKVDLDISKLTDRYSLPIRIKEELTVKEVIHTSADEWVLDFGQNFAGWISFVNDQPKGSVIHFDFGEVMQNNKFYNDNYRSAVGGFTYISDGKPKEVRPHFTFFGFRYAKVSGWQGALKKESFKGLVLYSDMERTGFFSTGDPYVNRLYENTLWGLKSNFIDTPTDCPQRDERLGWTGDAQVFSSAASYHMDTRAFYQKYLWDMRGEQLKRDGGIPAYVPSTKKGPINTVSAIWGDAAAIIPSVLKHFYGEKVRQKQLYPLVKDWVDYVAREIEKVHGTKAALWDFGFQFGDWLALDGSDEQAFKGSTPDDILATMFYLGSVGIAADFAEELGEYKDSREYRKLESDLRKLILDHFVTPYGHLSVPTQAAYINAIKFRIYRNKDVMAEDFASLLAKDGYKIRCGFAGAPVICQQLAEAGRTDLSYRFLFREDYPGWLFEVKMGATTVWERWNSILSDGSISGTDMNSLNHYSYGSVAEFLYEYTGGIRRDADGFTKAIIAPAVHGRIGHCNCTYYSHAGKYVCNWKLLNNGFVSVHTEIPFGAKATIVLPGFDGEVFEVEAGEYDYTYKPLKDFRRKFNSESLLGEILENPVAKERLHEFIPQAGMLAGMETVNIEALKGMGMLGITNDMVDAFLDSVKDIMWTTDSKTAIERFAPQQ